MTKTAICVLVSILLLLTAAARGAAPDRDGDGLSDYQETHKYRTNPEKADSDGDGREFEVFIKPSDFAKMTPGVPYQLVPGNNSKFLWVASEGVSLVRSPAK